MSEPDCWCEYVDIGVGMEKVDHNYECPACNEPCPTCSIVGQCLCHTDCPDGLAWILPTGTDHATWRNAAYWVHANSHIDSPDRKRWVGACFECWRAAAFALKGAYLVPEGDS